METKLREIKVKLSQDDKENILSMLSSTMNPPN